MSNSISSGGGGTPSSSAFDTSIDYSRRMYEAWQAGDMDAYNQAYEDRNTKIDIIGNNYGVDTNRLDEWIRSGGGYNDSGYFTDEWLTNNGFATGGYTGAWGPEGRIALVHEKELMLNPEDTINFLSGIEVLRDIVKTIDLESLRNRNTPIYSTMPIYETQPIREPLEQQVTISASFPAVTDRSEIEEAFNNLINTASQFANRKSL